MLDLAQFTRSGSRQVPDDGASGSNLTLTCNAEIVHVPARAIGRDASAETDAAMKAEMLSYSRSRGLSAGISLEGAILRPDEETDWELYGHAATNREILTGDFRLRRSRESLKGR